MKSIQAKMTMSIILIFFVSLAILGGSNYWKARDILIKNVNEDMKKSAVTAAASSGEWLKTHQIELTMLASNPVIQTGDIEHILPILINAKQANPEYDSVVFADATGASINESGARISVASRAFFKETMQGKTLISDPMTSAATGKTVVMVSIPVKNGGKMTGIVFGTVPIDVLKQKILDIKVGETGFASIVRKDGLFIIHPDQAVAMKVNSLTDENSDPGRKKLIGKMVAGETDSMQINITGVQRYVAFAPVPGMGWSLAISVPTDEVTKEVDHLTMLSISISVVVLLLAGIFVAWYARRMAKPLADLERAAQQIAGGDLSQFRMQLQSNDEIGRLGQSFSKMVENLRSLVKDTMLMSQQVAASAEELTASSAQSTQASNQVASAIANVAEGANEQLHAVDATQQSVGQISDGLRQMAVNADEMTVASKKAMDRSDVGSGAVDKAVNQMGEIAGSAQAVSEAIAKLNDKSKEIGQIVGTIAGIAGQTNLLALNAAIEAARAGEQGRGFAVVAEEVRKLAEESEAATKQIAALVGEIQNDTTRAVDAMQNGARDVQTGTEMVAEAGTAFREIADLVASASAQAKEVSDTVQKLVTGSQHIVDAVQTIDGLSKTSSDEAQSVSAATQQQLASMEEITSSSEALAKMAQDLQTAVTKFRL
ncbi:methyl-accepting chemotaxis protein [Anaerosinus massiliensis]|uniref:methyl-accepting chemotaxis protein n=1 Tax=Massilibacillus massiliensis TaxID=1806837 RepID=UPI000A72EA82|nr:methyl-accepting chemotaxis protein [Massilibacillus massiliensis]